jgi:hypothetical protein
VVTTKAPAPKNFQNYFNKNRYQHKTFCPKISELFEQTPLSTENLQKNAKKVFVQIKFPKPKRSFFFRKMGYPQAFPHVDNLWITPYLSTGCG